MLGLFKEGTAGWQLLQPVRAGGGGTRDSQHSLECPCLFIIHEVVGSAMLLWETRLALAILAEETDLVERLHRGRPPGSRCRFANEKHRGRGAVTEAQWLRCRNSQKMLQFLREKRKASERKLRLLACACCRRVWDLMPEPDSRHAVLVAERFADGLASEGELATVGRQAGRPARHAAARYIRKFPGAAGRAAAALRGSHAYNRLYEAYGEPLGRGAPREAVKELGLSDGAALDPRDAYLEAQALEAAEQTALIRDLFGPLPFREVSIAPTVRTWNDGCVVKIAQTAYEADFLPDGTLDRARLAVLADAFEEAGCADEEILRHLRGPGPHVRGCWVVDLLLGKS